MRELTPEEIRKLDSDACPFCGSMPTFFDTIGCMALRKCWTCEAVFKITRPGIYLREGMLMNGPRKKYQQTGTALGKDTRLAPPSLYIAAASAVAIVILILYCIR